MHLNTQQQMLVEQRVTNDAKSTGVAYLLWFFLGSLGAHRFYLGKTGTAVTMLILCILGWLTLVFIVGGFLLAALGIWLLVDAFLIPGMVRQDKEALRSRHMTNLLGATMVP